MKPNAHQFRLAGIVAALLVSGCATIVSGTQQSLFIDTPEVEGAKCQLTDSKGGGWYLSNSPGSITVTKGNGPMNIVCKKDGYQTATVSLEEDVAGATFGNIILGGGIGVFVDAASGAAQKYPDKAMVWMEPVKWKSEAARDEWHEKRTAYEIAEAKKREEQQAQNQPPPQRRY